MKKLIFYFIVLATCWFITYNLNAVPPYQVIDPEKLLDSINTFLNKSTDYHPYLSFGRKDTIVIHVNTEQYFRFSIADLVPNTYAVGKDINGIEAIACDKRTVAPHAMIYFNRESQQLAFLKLKCIDDAELYQLQSLLVRLFQNQSVITRFKR
jgi:hypothetical protein